jgi:hypothetical protein
VHTSLPTCTFFGTPIPHVPTANMSRYSCGSGAAAHMHLQGFPYRTTYKLQTSPFRDPIPRPREQHCFTTLTESHILRFSDSLRGIPTGGVQDWMRSWDRMHTALTALGFRRTCRRRRRPLACRCTRVRPPPDEEWQARGKYAADAIVVFLLLNPDTPDTSPCHAWLTKIQQAMTKSNEILPQLRRMATSLQTTATSKPQAVEPAFNNGSSA